MWIVSFWHVFHIFLFDVHDYAAVSYHLCSTHPLSVSSQARGSFISLKQRLMNNENNVIFLILETYIKWNMPPFYPSGAPEIALILYTVHVDETLVFRCSVLCTKLFVFVFVIFGHGFVLNSHSDLSQWLLKDRLVHDKDNLSQLVTERQKTFILAYSSRFWRCFLLIVGWCIPL